VVFEEAVDAAASWTAAKALAEFVKIFGGACRDYLDVAVFGVADPAAEVELAGFAVNKPTKADTLYASLDKEVENHSDHFSLSEAGLGAQLAARYTGATHGFCTR
jgi:hypothetical protein